MSIIEKNLQGKRFSPVVFGSLFFRVNKVYNNYLSIAIHYPLKTKNWKLLLQGKQETCLSINTGFVTVFVTK